MREGMHDRRRIDFRPVRHEAEQQLGFRHDLVSDERHGLRPRQRRPPPSERDLQPQAVARHDLAPELGVVHAAQRDARVGRRIRALQEQNRGHLSQRLEHQHGRQQRRARKMSLEELFVDRDVLDGDETAARLIFRDRVHEEGRIPIAEPIEEDGDIDHG